MHDPTDRGDLTDEEIGRVVRHLVPSALPLLELLGRALGANGSPSTGRVHQHGDAAALAELGISSRWLADEARAGRIAGAVRGGRGWSATREAILDRLAERGQRKAIRARATLSVVPAAGGDGADRDRQLLVRAAGGGRPR